MLAKSEVEKAVFWDKQVCLACEAITDPTDEEGEERCEACGSGDVLPAAQVLRVLAVVGEEME